MLKHLAVVERVDVFPNRVIESGQLVNCEDDARELRYADERDNAFMEKVIKANLDLVKGYKHKESDYR